MIIFFSHNSHKAREIEQILQTFQVRLYSEFVKPFNVVECGKTFAQNAKIKLMALKENLPNNLLKKANKDQIILMAEDSGICIESLDNLPGIFSSRFANMPRLEQLSLYLNDRLESDANFADSLKNIGDSSDLKNISRVIKELKERNLAESNAVFVSCVSFAILQKHNSNVRFLTTHGFLSGKVICEMRGENGFGYDPIFIANGFNKTLAELTPSVKNNLSHRKNALDLMSLLLK